MKLSDSREKISREILSYLRKHPDAGDTLEGICTWWLELERIELTVDEVEAVLKSLMKKGIIKKHKLSNGKNIYKINMQTNQL